MRRLSGVVTSFGSLFLCSDASQTCFLLVTSAQCSLLSSLLSMFEHPCWFFVLCGSVSDLGLGGRSLSYPLLVRERFLQILASCGHAATSLTSISNSMTCPSRWHLGQHINEDTRSVNAVLCGILTVPSHGQQSPYTERHALTCR